MNFLSGFPRTVRKLLRNKPFMANMFCTLCQPYIIMGVNANIVRYVEIHFLERAFVASIIAGKLCFYYMHSTLLIYFKLLCPVMCARLLCKRTHNLKYVSESLKLR